MADLLREFTDPAVMDIKMGVRYVGGEGNSEGGNGEGGNGEGGKGEGREMMRGGKW